MTDTHLSAESRLYGFGLNYLLTQGDNLGSTPMVSELLQWLSIG